MLPVSQKKTIQTFQFFQDNGHPPPPICADADATDDQGSRGGHPRPLGWPPRDPRGGYHIINEVK